MTQEEKYECKRTDCFYYHPQYSRLDNTCNYILQENKPRGQYAYNCTHYVQSDIAEKQGKVLENYWGK